jgi:hypothetical protein
MKPAIYAKEFPYRYNGLAFWFRASDIIDVADSGTVLRINDRSHNSMDFVQLTANNRPIYLSNQINGYPALIGDASNDFMTSTRFHQVATGWSVFSVVSRTWQTAGDCGIMSFGSAGQTMYFKHNAFTQFAWQAKSMLVTGNTTTSGVPPQAHTAPLTEANHTWLILSCTIGPTRARIYKNGVDITADSLPGATLQTAGGVSFGFISAGAAFPWRGKIAETLFYHNWDFDDYEHKQMHDYLNDIYKVY